MRAVRSGALGLAGGALVLFLVAMPKLETFVLGTSTVTPSRVLLLLAAASLGVYLLVGRRSGALRDPLVLSLAGVLIVTVALVWSSAETNGCDCRGQALGLSQFAAATVLALALLCWAPRWHGPLLRAAAGGSVLAGVLAITHGLSHGGGRLVGTYGNPNNLAFALAVGVPILTGLALEERRWSLRIGYGALGVGLTVLTFLTYSRGTLLALGAGVLAAAAARATTPKPRIALAVVTTAAVVLGVVLYPLFSTSRLRADVSGVSPEVVAKKLSGWDPYRTGLIPAGPSQLKQLPGGALRIRTRAPRQGASIALTYVGYRERVTARFTARAPLPGTLLAVSLEDNQFALGPASRLLVVSRAPRRFALRWRPQGDSIYPRLFMELPKRGIVELSAITIRRAGFPAATPLTTAPIPASGLLHYASQRETHNVRFRERMFELAWQAFVHDPLRGVGWQEFPQYVNAHSSYGAQSAQSEYPGYLAQLGIGGLAVLVGLIACAVAGVRRARRDRPALVGALVLMLVGEAFNATLEMIPVSAGIAAVLALTCAPPSADRVPPTR
jgi:hypothetical protein